MNIFTNWIFWVIVAAIVFVLAIIGYLSESKKKNKKALESDSSANETNVVSNVDVTSAKINETQPTLASSINDSDFNVMPEINSVTVSQPSQTISNSSLDSSVFGVPSTLETPVAAPAEIAPVVETPVSIEPASVFTSNIDQIVSEPTPVPAEPIPAITPSPMPADVNTEVKMENMSANANDNIETL